MDNTSTTTSAALTPKSKYDPIQIIHDYLADNPNSSSSLSNYLINRLGDQIIWYDSRSTKYKKVWLRYRRTTIILSATIPFLVGLIGLTVNGQSYPMVDLALKFIVGAAGVSIAILEGLNSLYKNQELHIEYRQTAERLRQEFCFFLGRGGKYEGLDDQGAYAKLTASCETIMGDESSRWTEVARQNEKAVQSDDIRNAVEELMKKYATLEAKGSEGKND